MLDSSSAVRPGTPLASGVGFVRDARAHEDRHELVAQLADDHEALALRRGRQRRLQLARVVVRLERAAAVGRLHEVRALLRAGATGELAGRVALGPRAVRVDRHLRVDRRRRELLRRHFAEADVAVRARDLRDVGFDRREADERVVRELRIGHRGLAEHAVELDFLAGDRAARDAEADEDACRTRRIEARAVQPERALVQLVGRQQRFLRERAAVDGARAGRRDGAGLCGTADST